MIEHREAYDGTLKSPEFDQLLGAVPIPHSTYDTYLIMIMYGTINDINLNFKSTTQHCNLVFNF